MKNLLQTSANEITQQFQQEHGKRIIDLLGETNRAHLNGKGKLLLQPFINGNLVRWTLTWMQDQIAFDLNIVLNLVSNGGQAQVESVFVHRHASTPYDFPGHTPTTRMRRVKGFSMTAIKDAIQAEFVQDELPRWQS